jgi:hypothetical protein
VAKLYFGRYLNDTQLEITGQFVALAVAAAGLGVALTCVNFFYLSYSGDSTDISSWGSFFTTYGTLFAIISGMVLVNVLERFQALQTVVEDELNAIERIRDSLVYLDLHPTTHTAFLQGLLDYLHLVAQSEWDEMSIQFRKDAPNIDSDTNAELTALHGLAASILRQKQGVAGGDLIASLIVPLILDLGTFRTHRLSLAFFLVIGFILMNVENLFVNIFMTVAVSGAIQWLYTIISDLDHPFFGIWNVDREQLDKLIQKFENAIARGTTRQARSYRSNCKYSSMSII